MPPPSSYERMLVRYTHWLLDHRWWVLLLSLLAVGALAAGARHLGFSTDYRVYFGKDNPQLQAFDEFQKIYTKTDNILFVLEPRQGDVFQPRVLEAVHRLTEEAWTLPYTLRVDSITNYQHTRAQGDDLEVRALIQDASELTPARVDEIRAIAVHDPLLLDRLVPPNGAVTAVNVVSQFPEASEAEVPSTVSAARDLRDRILREFPEVGTIYMTGSNMMSYAFTEAATADMKTLIPAMYAVIVVVMWLMLRSVTAMLATMLIVAASSIAAMGAAGYAGMQLTPPSVAAPQIITTLAVADCIHLYLTMLALVRMGRGKREAIVESMRQNFTPVFLTSATTAIGFLAINFTDSPPLRDLGNITVVGILLAWLLSCFTLPALMAVLPLRVTRAPRAPRDDRLTKTLDALADRVVRWRRPLFWSVLGASLLLTILAFRNEPNDLFAHYFDDSIAFREDTDAVTEKLTGFYSIDFSLRAAEPGGVADPEYLARVEAFADWWRTGPYADRVRYVGPITDVFKRLNRNLHGDDPAFYRLPQDRQLAAQYLLLYEMSLPFGLDLNNSINVDKSASRFTVLFDHLKSKETRAIEQAARAWLAEHGMETIGVSPAVMFAYIAERNIRSNFLSLPLSLVAISLLLLPALRSVKLSALSLVPNLLPLGAAFGIWYLIDGEIKFVQAIVLNMTIGIIVDATIHFLNKYLRGRRELGLQPEAAVRHAFHTVGTALVATTAILVAGFALLAQSAFLPNAANAALTCLVLVSALAVDLLFLPPLLLLVERRATAKANLALEIADDVPALK